jgi:hypothetical protein
MATADVEQLRDACDIRAIGVERADGEIPVVRG